MKEEKWWAGEDRAPTLRPLLVRGQGNEICRKPKGIRKFRETLSHGCTANMICASLRSGAADWRSGSRWSILSVLCPVHPFPLRGTSPQGETRDMREKTASHILQVPFRRFPPLVAGATTLPGGKHVTGFAGRLQLPYESSSFATPRKRGHNKAP